MRVALAGCVDYPDVGATEGPLWAALERLGVGVDRPGWDEEGVDWGAFELVVVRAAWNYHHAPRRFLAWADAVARDAVLCNPPSLLRWNSEKTYLRELAGRGLPVAPTVWLAVGEDFDLREELAERGWERAFLKPVVGAVACDTLRFLVDESGLAEASALLAKRPAGSAMMLQPYLAGVERDGEVSVMLVDGEVTHAVRKVPVAGDYRVQDAHGASDHAVTVDDELAELARRALAAVPGREVPLYARADFLFDGGGRPLLNELELIEPMFFFEHDARAAETFAAAVAARVGGS
ncbi:MAG: hypothetical protein QF903_07290 [Planctomycetota bacterium]|nr:hypothetical protein [Planctomycetota bacterium]MDP6762453.1 hypothetical protein [Planctomycetota bacterium]MDP6989269.1 hypothetical protein [Planctomycetota bacterium]